MNKIVLKKENGEVRIVNADMELIRSLKAGYTNPCFTCQNGNAIDCPKIADNSKKNIAKYDFITDGYQINNTDGELENLVVNKCSNYTLQEERPRSKTKEEIESLKRLKESIKILYFNTETIEEADRTQKDLMKRGLIYEYNPGRNRINK